MPKEETEIIFDTEDDRWIKWYICNHCKSNMVTECSKYCSNCGYKIITDLYA
jgi:hypothetical protein